MTSSKPLYGLGLLAFWPVRLDRLSGFRLGLPVSRRRLVKSELSEGPVYRNHPPLPYMVPRLKVIRDGCYRMIESKGISWTASDPH